MILGTRHNLAHNNHIDVYLDNQLTENVLKQKLLGMIIDPTLSWDKQVGFVGLGVARKITLPKLLSVYAIRKALSCITILTSYPFLSMGV